MHFFLPLDCSLTIPTGVCFTFPLNTGLPWLNNRTIQPTRDITADPRRPNKKGELLVYIVTREVTIDRAMPSLDPYLRAARVASFVSMDDDSDDDLLDCFQTMVDYPISQPSDNWTCTVFEMVTPLVPSDNDSSVDIEDSITKAFDRCLGRLQLLCAAYIDKTHDLRVPIPSRQNIHPFVPWISRPLNGFQFGNLGILMTNRADRYAQTIEPPMNNTDLDDLIDRLFALQIRDSFSIAIRHSRFARQIIDLEGNYAVSVVWTYMASEALLDAVLLLMAWEDKMDEDEVVELFGSSLSRRIRRYYPQHLKGGWNIQDPNSTIGRWGQHVRDMRNIVVHSGHQPDEAEARIALATLEELETYVKDQLAIACHRYPCTALVLLGQTGLRERGLLSRRFSRRIKALVDRGWREDFNQWEKHIREMVEKR